MSIMTDDAQIIARPESLAQTDPETWQLIGQEQTRQEQTLEMIASENHTSSAVMAAVGSCLTNKYCEGYPGKRYYSGCDFYDEIEQLAIDRAKELFDCEFANVQPHSGANANLAAFFALLEPGDTYAGVVLSDGGHLTHGSPVNISGKWFNPVHYPLVYDESRDDFGHIDYDAVADICREHQPKLLICGYSAYPRTIDFERFRAIADECGALLMCDMAHIAGLVAGGSHPSPFPHCDLVTTTTHKTLRGPRGGLILTNDEGIATSINKAVFPGTQGGPLMHVIAGKAVCFHEALQPSFKTYAREVVDNAQVLAETLQGHGWQLAAGGTDNHLVLMDLRRSDTELTGKEAAARLESAGIITNKNTVPNDDRSPFVTSGVRLGTPALTTRGLDAEAIAEVAGLIDRVLKSDNFDADLAAVQED
ncbi:MAG: serine hydroxymethyltransferase, partial [Phycisphaeraceae bacterium]|nr:serine hydroxymethyltransferase [Phycisphaeraceae bacterium]